MTPGESRIDELSVVAQTRGVQISIRLSDCDMSSLGARVM